jgi:hypothetical protein
MSNEIVTTESYAGSAFGDLATVGPQLTLPRAGTYELSYGCLMNGPTGSGFIAEMAPVLGSTAAADASCVGFGAGNAGGSTVMASASRTYRAAGMHAGDVVKLQYKGLGGTSSFQNRWLKIVPVSVT